MKTRDRTRNDGKKKRRKPPGEDGKSQVFVWYPACDFYRVLGSSKSIGTVRVVTSLELDDCTRGAHL